MRNTRKAISWVKSNPSCNELRLKISEVTEHIGKYGIRHKSYSDFSGALFILRQEEFRRKGTDEHLQSGFDF